MNKTTVAVTKEQYISIIQTMRAGFIGFRPNPRAAMALILEANLGTRVSDNIKLCLNHIIHDGDRYRLDIREQKTKKKRTFTVPLPLYVYLQQYCLENNIKPNERIIPVTTRAVEKALKKVADYLGYENIGTHSFRKFFATNIYMNNEFDIVLAQQLLQHTSIETTKRYIGIGSKTLETAIQNNLNLI